jgi:hypothetical protein
MSAHHSLDLFPSHANLLALCASLAGFVSPASCTTSLSSTNKAALPLPAFAATSQAELTTTDSHKINAQPTNKTTISNINSNGDGSLSNHDHMYDPAVTGSTTRLKAPQHTMNVTTPEQLLNLLATCPQDHI